MQVDRDIEFLEAAIAQMVQRQEELQHTYLRAIAPALKRHLFQAVFQRCTQADPAAFLALGISDRHALQQELQRIGEQAAQDMIARAPVADSVDGALAEVLTQALGRSQELLRQYGIGTPEMELKLAPLEIETGDRTLMALRGELRVLASRHAQHQEQLRKKQRLKMVLTAEAAWHATWVKPDDKEPPTNALNQPQLAADHVDPTQKNSNS
jgi:hypothetical protein